MKMRILETLEHVMLTDIQNHVSHIVNIDDIKLSIYDKHTFVVNVLGVVSGITVNHTLNQGDKMRLSYLFERKDDGTVLPRKSQIDIITHGKMYCQANQFKPSQSVSSQNVAKAAEDELKHLSPYLDFILK